MTVYIEYVILDNLIIDFLIVFMLQTALKTHFGKWNWVLVLVEGITFAIITPLFTLNTYLMLLIKWVYSICMVLSLRKYANFKQFVIHYLIFLSLTFVLGGVCYALLNALNIPYNDTGIVLNGYAVPISLLILLAFVYVYLMIKLIKYYHKRKSCLPYYYDIVLTIAGKDHYIRGYLDSGNRLYDNVDGKPVAVLSFGTFCKIFDDFPFHKLLLSNVTSDQLEGAHYIKVNSVDVSKQMLVFTAERMQIQYGGKTIDNRNVSLGVSTKNFGGAFECLLHSDLMEGRVC